MTFYKGMTDEELDNVIVQNIQVKADDLPGDAVLIIPACRLGDLEKQVREMLRFSNDLDF